MSINVNAVIDGIIQREGGFSNHPSDRGGPTKYGITQATLGAYLRRPATLEDVQALTVEQAKEIYLRNYYLGPRFDTLPDPIEAFIVDVGVMSGPGTAIKILQRVLNEAGFGPVEVDGRLGPATRGVAEQAQATMGTYLLNALVIERLEHLDRIIANDATQRTFRKGWRRRTLQFWVDTAGLTKPTEE